MREQRQVMSQVILTMSMRQDWARQQEFYKAGENSIKTQASHGKSYGRRWVHCSPPGGSSRQLLPSAHCPRRPPAPMHGLLRHRTGRVTWWPLPRVSQDILILQCSIGGGGLKATGYSRQGWCPLKGFGRALCLSKSKQPRLIYISLLSSSFSAHQPLFPQSTPSLGASRGEKSASGLILLVFVLHSTFSRKCSLPNCCPVFPQAPVRATEHVIMVKPALSPASEFQEEVISYFLYLFLCVPFFVSSTFLYLSTGLYVAARAAAAVAVYHANYILQAVF